MEEQSSLTPQEVADILKIAKNTVYELIKRGELSAYKVGRKVRVDLKDVEEYKNKGKSIISPLSSTAAFPMHPSHLITAEQDRVPVSHKDEFIICGQDAILDLLTRHLDRYSPKSRALRSYIGSYNGLHELYLGNVSMATAHLWDGDTGQYNVPYVRKLLPGIPAVIIHLVCRFQGFYVPKGNPMNIKNWEDLGRKGLNIINREKGSGTRVLLDEQLRKHGIIGYSIEGYHREEFSHLGVASAVSRGEADVGLGNEKASMQVAGIDFIPLQKEHYDLVIKKEDLHHPTLQTILKILVSPEFKSELQGIGGYDLSDLGKVVAEI